MKYLIASDIHGSAYYCEKLAEAFHREGADRLILLGDILYHGPRNDLPRDYAPKKVAAMLNELSDRTFGVRGNCEAEIDCEILNFPMSADYAIMEQKGRIVFLTHGHIYNLGKLPPLKEGDVLLHGHTHVPACEAHDGIWYLNPGSVSIPKSDSAHSYMTLCDGVFSWHELDGKEYESLEL